MRLFVYLLLILPLTLSAQDSSDYINLLYKQKPIKVAVYKTESSPVLPVMLEMPFNSDSILNPKAAAALKYFTPSRIDLVYTAYKEAKSFSQPELNKKRMLALMKIAPGLFDNNQTEWRFIAQTSAPDADSAASLFHGFVIYPRVDTSFIDTEAELQYLIDVLDSTAKFLDEHDSLCYQSIVKYKKKYVATGLYLPKSERLRKSGARSETKTAKFPYVEKRAVMDTIYAYDTIPCRELEKLDLGTMRWLKDSTVMKVFERNRQWKNKMVVTDVTGSMSPYTVQLLIWYKLRENSSDIKRFAFFNDGDNKPDERKVIGSTGGIYFAEGNKGFETMATTVFTAMGAGSGGDQPENNIEALLKSLSNCPDCSELVMIADNYAPVKDIMLLNRLTKPVHIILCGAEEGPINADYLQIARKTGGTVHTMERDLVDLVKYKEGEIVQMGTQVFKITNGKFVLVDKL
jgi:hypothetical protein